MDSSNDLFQANGYFELHGCDAPSNGALAFSGFDRVRNTKIELQITDIRAIETRTILKQFAIRLADAQYLDGFTSKPAETLDIDLKIYAISGPGWRGYIVGGACWLREGEAPAVRLA